MTTIRLIAPPNFAALLADNLQTCGIRCAENADDSAAVVILSTLSAADIAATAATLSELDAAGENAVIAAQMPPDFPFSAALIARAKQKWNRPPLTIPTLRTSADFANAAKIIADSLSDSRRDSDSAVDSDSAADSGSDSGSDSVADVVADSRLSNAENAESDVASGFADSPAAAVARARRALDGIL